jgi:hypothetical protein
MLLFGSYNILIGYLIVRSTFLPRILGVLLAISGVCYQIDNFAGLPFALVPGPSGALHSGARRGGTVAPLWLVVVGVNVERWKEQANRTGVSQC